jgi:hypothetical protein
MESPLESEPREMEQAPEELPSLNFEEDMEDGLFEENSDLEIENPYLEIDKAELDDKTELDINSSDFEMGETELEVDETELEIDETELDIDSPDFEMDETEFEIDETELDIDSSDFEMDETELEVNETEFEIDETELDIDSSDFEMDETELEVDETELEVDETELEVDETELKIDETDIEMDDDNTFAMENDIPSQTHEIEKNHLELEDDDIKFGPIEGKQAFLAVKKETAEEDINEERPLISEGKDTIDPEKPSLASEENFPEKPEKNDDLEKQAGPKEKPAALAVEKEIELEHDLPEKTTQKVEDPPKKRKKVIVKPRPAAHAKTKPVVNKRPKSKKEKKKSRFRTPVLILMIIFLLAIGGYIASVMTGYKLPAIDQFIKKPITEITEVKPIPNQKSVNGRFVTNSTAGTLFIITGRVDNPSNIAYSHIEIRGALITKNKEEAKIKNIFCGNIITEEMLKTGNISDINTLLTLKEGVHQTNVNVAPGASVPFMVVFSNLPEKLQNFTVKIAGFDKVDKQSIN